MMPSKSLIKLAEKCGELSQIEEHIGLKAKEFLVVTKIK